MTAARAGDFAEAARSQLYRHTRSGSAALNACDFGDLLLHSLTLFAQAARRAGALSAQFRYILVDEYQDTNVAQYLWLRLLAQGTATSAASATTTSRSTGWRGAEVGNILRFEKDFPGATDHPAGAELPLAPATSWPPPRA